MKSILLIGLGRFGKFIAMKLHTMGHQVMAVDTSEDRINDVMRCFLMLPMHRLETAPMKNSLLLWVLAITIPVLLPLEITSKTLWKPLIC